MAETLRMTGRWCAWTCGGLLSLATLFLLTAWIGSAIPRGERLETIDMPVNIMVETNGVHTQIVVPIVHPIKDWRETFPNASAWINGTRPTHISIGFGEREVFMHTPRWTDLTLANALRVVGFGGDGLIRVTPFVNPARSRDRRALVISQAQYRALVQQILAELPPLEDRAFRSFDRAEYAPQDAYYAARRPYTMLTTCNQWTSDRLAGAGIRTGRWTPLSGGVMKWVPPYSTDLSVD